jgi:hypothetical protein
MDAVLIEVEAAVFVKGHVAQNLIISWTDQQLMLLRFLAY